MMIIVVNISHCFNNNSTFHFRIYIDLEAGHVCPEINIRHPSELKWRPPKLEPQLVTMGSAVKTHINQLRLCGFDHVV